MIGVLYQVNDRYSSFSGQAPASSTFTKAVHSRTPSLSKRPISPPSGGHAEGSLPKRPRSFRVNSQSAPPFPNIGAHEASAFQNNTYPSVLSALADTSILYQSSSAQPNRPGMINSTLSLNASTKRCESKTPAPFYVACGNAKVDATRNMMACMPARVAEVSHTVLACALEHRRRQPLTPYKADAWELALQQAGLMDRFPSIPAGLRHGFIVGYPVLSCVQTPRIVPPLPFMNPNSKTL